MSTPPTLIPLYWAVLATGFLIFVIFVLILAILRNNRDLDNAGDEIARLMDERRALSQKLDHAREAIKNATGFVTK